jgi:hypothetical protein
MINLSPIKTMQKTIVIRHKADCLNDSFVPGTLSQRIAFVWPLTREVVSLSKKYDAERRLQRNVTSFMRRKG